MSKTAKTELTMQKERRVAHFQKSVAELAELEVKHAKAHAQMLRQVITRLWLVNNYINPTQCGSFSIENI